jgi:hypothetical protein
MAKIIRLTESDLNKIVRRVLREQAQDQASQELPSEDGYEKQVRVRKEMEEKLKSHFQGNPTQITFPNAPNKVIGAENKQNGKMEYFQNVQFMISNVIIPSVFDTNALRVPPRVITLVGNRIERQGDDVYGYSDKPLGRTGSAYDSPYIEVKYLCKRNEKNKTAPLNYMGKADFTIYQTGFSKMDVKLQVPTVEYIENNWCIYQPEPSKTMV